MREKKLALYGYGGHAKEVAACIGGEVTFFVDDIYATDQMRSISTFDPCEFRILVAVGNSKDRYDMVQRLPKDTEFFTYIHPTALLLDSNIQIGKGSFVGPYCILTTNIALGDHILLNRAVHIGHDTVVGNFFSAMPGAVVSGNVRIYDLVYMGTNSTIKEGIEVHSLSTIGMSAAITKHITTPGTYVGVPAKLI